MGQTDDPIEQLVERIYNSFPRQTFPRDLLVAYGSVDADRLISVLKINWWELTPEHMRVCGSDEIVSLTSAEGMLYYLPGFLSVILKQRDFGWFEEALLPAHPLYRDVVEYFSGGALSGPMFERSSDEFFARVCLIRGRLNLVQRQCVANYLEVALTSQHSAEVGCDAVLDRLVKFWLTDSLLA